MVFTSALFSYFQKDLKCFSWLSFMWPSIICVSCCLGSDMLVFVHLDATWHIIHLCIKLPKLYIVFVLFSIAKENSDYSCSPDHNPLQIWYQWVCNRLRQSRLGKNTWSCFTDISCCFSSCRWRSNVCWKNCGGWNVIWVSDYELFGYFWCLNSVVLTY